MHRPGPARWTFVLAALLPLVFVQGASARALYRCVYDGIARTSCCCAGKSAQIPVSHATASRASCCKVEHLEVVSAQARLERSDRVVPRAPVCTSALPPRVAKPSLPTALLMRARVGASPPLNTPLILLKSSLLI